jgi:DNA-binding response OmpR family regulator
MTAINQYDVIILDRMLPDFEGTEVLKTLRSKGLKTPVIFLTAKDSISDRIAGLDAGADDYLVKPFAFEELLARIRALLRRPHHTKDVILRYAELELDPINFGVKRAGRPIRLTTKEFALLEYLLRNPERVLTKEAIINHVWNYDADILPNTVEVYIGYLRQKIDKPFPDAGALIHTRHGFGYFFGQKP